MKKILVGGLTAAVLLSGVIILAAVTRADSDSDSTSATKVKGFPAMVLEVNKNGKLLLRGTLESIGSSTLAVKSWGGVWTVNIASATEVLPVRDISRFQTGDFIGVQGTVNKDALWTIDATTVRDWNTVKAVEAEKRENKKEAEAIMRASLPKNWQGLASNVNTSNNSLTLTINNTAYSVNLTSDAKLYNRNWLTIIFGDVKNGDTVRVWGPLASSTITASVLRDISIPVQSNSGKKDD